MLSTPPYQWLFYDPGHQLQDLLMSFHDIAVNFTVLSLLPLPTPLSAPNTPTPRPPGLSRLDHAFLRDALSLVTSAYRNVTSTSDVNQTALGFRDEINRVIRQVGL